MDLSRQIGIAAALFAAFAWSLNFVVPFVIGGYTVFDFALLRFGVSGLVGFAMLAASRKTTAGLALRDWLVAAWLAFIGYVGYFLTVTGAAYYAGPVVAPAFVGLVPIVVAIAGNLRQHTLPWRRLAFPLLLVTIGMLMVNLGLAGRGTETGDDLWIGIPLAVGAVGLWTWFAMANQAALASRPHMDPRLWTALILAGGGVEMLLFFPIGSVAGLFEFPRLGFGWGAAGQLYLWGISLALLASVGGVWAWNLATRHLPVALAAQLVVSETLFGTLLGLLVHGRWPTPAEASGIFLLTAGVVVAIRVFHQPPAISGGIRPVQDQTLNYDGP